MSELVSPDVTIVGRLGSSPHERGSTNGATCPDILRVKEVLGRTAIGVIGEMPEPPRDDEAYIVVPPGVVVDAFASLLRDTA